MSMFSPVQQGFRALVPLVTSAATRAHQSCIEPVLRYNEVRRDLASLSDRTLDDIGISRTVSVHVSRPHRHLRAPH